MPTKRAGGKYVSRYVTLTKEIDDIVCEIARGGGRSPSEVIRVTLAAHPTFRMRLREVLFAEEDKA